MDLGATRHSEYGLIAHITDTHLYAAASGELLSVNTAQSLQRVIDDIVAFPEAIDAVIVTGDLVHDDSADAYRRLLAMLSTLSVPVFCLAGNHDVTPLMHSILNRGLVTTQTSMLLGRWAYRLLHTPVAGEVAGWLTDTELVALQTWLEQHRQYHVGLALHHHPMPVGCQWLDALALGNGQVFIDTVAKHSQVRLVFWGHVHQAWTHIDQGRHWLSTPSTCAQFKPHAVQFALDAPVPAWRWIRCYATGVLETGLRYLS